MELLFPMRFLAVFVLGWLAAVPALAGPWLDPGDAGLRHDVMLLADAGVIRAPVSTWPLAVDALHAAIDPSGIELDAGERAALARLRARLEREMDISKVRFTTHVSGAEHPRRARTFQDTPRETAEFGAGIEWTGGRFAARLRGQVVDDPDDNKDLRADGSYLGFVLGNWMFAASTSDRYWGPGWQSSMILSNGARPIPSFTVERNHTDAFDSKWLSWIGPWDAAVMWGYLDDDREIDSARVFGVRLDTRPLRGLEVGFSGLGLWCGSGQDCSGDEWFDLVTGSGTTKEYDRLFGFDIRYATKVFGVPMAGYSHIVGEDFGDGSTRLLVPNKLLGQFGVETWGVWDSLGSYRVFLEWADTECDFALMRRVTGDGDGGKPGCAYRNQRYKSGQTYRGLSYAHSLDQDSSVATLGMVLQDVRDHSWFATLAYGDLNRRGANRNTIARNQTRYVEFEVSHGRKFWIGDVRLGLGYEYQDDEVEDNTDQDVRVFAEWRLGY
jgi:hypothetical protein